MIPIEVTVLSKVIEQDDVVHWEQHPDPPCDEHTTIMIIMVMIILMIMMTIIPTNPLTVGADVGAEQEVVVGRA